MRHTWICPLLLVVASGCKQPDGGTAGADRGPKTPGEQLSPPVQKQDSESGLTLRLSLSKATCKPGQTIRATATIENTTSGSLAIHALDIVPTYVPKAEIDRPHVDDSKVLLGWRLGYARGATLDFRGPPNWCLLGDAYSGSESEVKKAYDDQLFGAKYPDFPAYAVPAGHTVSTSVEIEIRADGGFVDVGVFGREWWYTQEVLYYSGQGSTRAPRSQLYKSYPKIWTGSLYVKIPVHVR